MCTKLSMYKCSAFLRKDSLKKIFDAENKNLTVKSIPKSLQCIITAVAIKKTRTQNLLYTCPHYVSLCLWVFWATHSDLGAIIYCQTHEKATLYREGIGWKLLLRSNIITYVLLWMFFDIIEISALAMFFKHM